jgi:hypothetical protein
MPVIVIAGGGILGVLLGGIARVSYRQGWPDSKNISVSIVALAGAGVAGLFQVLPGQGSWLPLLYGYLVSVMTGYVVTAMLEVDPGIKSVPAGVARTTQSSEDLAPAPAEPLTAQR